MPGSPNCARARDTARPVDAADPLLIITVEAVVTLRGELDRSVEDDVTRRVAVAVEAADRIEIDARDVSFLDAAGIRAFLVSKQHACDRGVSVSFRFARPGPVERVLALAGLTQAL